MGGIRIVCRECAADLEVTLASNGELTARVGACGQCVQLGVRLGLQRLVAQMEGGDGVGAARHVKAKPAAATPKTARRNKAAATSGRLCACGCGHPAIARPGGTYAYGHKPAKGAAAAKCAKPAHAARARAPVGQTDPAACVMCNMVDPKALKRACAADAQHEHLVCSQCATGKMEMDPCSKLPRLKVCPVAVAKKGGKHTVASK